MGSPFSIIGCAYLSKFAVTFSVFFFGKTMFGFDFSINELFCMLQENRRFYLGFVSSILLEISL